MHNSGIVKLIVTLVVLSFLFDWYIASALGVLTSSVPRRRAIRWIYLGISITVTLLFLFRLSSFRDKHGMQPLSEWLLSLFLTFLITKIFFVLVLFLGDISRLLVGLVRRLGGWNRSPVIPGRRRFIIDSAILFAAIPFTSFFYAMLKGKYDYRVHRVVLHYPDLPAAFDGFTITQLSDIHSGSFDNTAAVQRGIDLVKAQKSDLFVFTGDLVNNVNTEIDPYVDMFGAIKAPYGQYSTLGNHDYGDYIHWDNEQEKADNLEALKAKHAKMGYRLLMDEHVLIEKDGQHLVLAGVQNWGKGFIQLGDIDKALAGVDKTAFKILLSHDPSHWEAIVRYHEKEVQLTLSGHTHGAQFGVETPTFRWSPVQYRYLDWAGLANEGNRQLYVNRGFGFLAFSGRLGIWPEITVLELRRG